MQVKLRAVGLVALGSLLLTGCGEASDGTRATPDSTVTTATPPGDPTTTRDSRPPSTTSTTTAPTTTTSAAPTTTPPPPPTTPPGPSPADCTAEALVPQLVSARHVYEPLEILEVRCVEDPDSGEDLMGVRILSSDSCGKGPASEEVLIAYRWDGAGWTLDEIENSRAQWGCVGESIE